MHLALPDGGVQNEPHPETDLPFRITALDIEPKTPIRSGEWMAITVRGEVAAHVDPDYRLEIRVRALQNAQIVYVVDLTSREPRLAQPGTFEATVQLQANMANGYFSIETPVWHVRERREVGQSTEGARPRGRRRVFRHDESSPPRADRSQRAHIGGLASLMQDLGVSLLYINIQARQNQAGTPALGGDPG